MFEYELELMLRKNFYYGYMRWRFRCEFSKVKLGQHLGGSLEKVLYKTHLERTLTRVVVLKIFWRQFNIFINVILQEENTSIYRKKLRLILVCKTSLLKTLKLENDMCQAMNR